MMRIRYIFILCLLFSACFSYSQQSKIDSLKVLIKKDKEDTNKVNHLKTLGWELMYINPDTSIILANQSLYILNSLKNTIDGNRIAYLLSNIYGDLGAYNYLKANYPISLDYYLKALKLVQRESDKKIASSILGNIGNVYYSKGDHVKTLEYYLKALKINEEFGDINGITTNLSNIGNVYSDMKDYTKALDYYFKALKFDEMVSDKNGISTDLGNIGIVYYNRADYIKALDYYLRAMKLNEELGNKNNIAIQYGNIGELYTKIPSLPSIFGEKKKGFELAEYYLMKAIAINDSIGALDKLMSNQINISHLYDTLGQYNLALTHYKKAMALKDTIFNQEKEKDITRKEMNFEFEKKEAATQAEHDKQQALSEAEKKRQRIFLLFVGAIAISVAVIALIIFRSLRVTKRQKIVIEKQKHLVDEKQKEIIDSITYAKRLQEAILPPLELIKKHLPNSFILYKPKDIVAGDFYWMETIDNTTFIAAADCTGHGVPGAMVSVVCSNALNRAVKEFGLRETGKILDKVTDLVLETFEKSSSEVKDGMDISLLSLETGGKIQWSGANNPLWYISNGKIIEVKAYKQPIGKYEHRKSFITQNIEYSENSMFYLFTDGLPDQFGGHKGKKFMYKRFGENLTSICNLPLEEQKETISKSFLEWKGSLEQVDDVTVIGIRV